MKIRKNSGFTLVEVILAVAIASGLLVVAISYYQRSADLRGKLLEESERLAAMRLVMDRITSDLRTAFAEPREGFVGSADSMRFVHAGSPTSANLLEGSLKLVVYSAVTNLAGTNSVVIGFDRVESPLVELRVSTNSISAPTTLTNEPVAFHGEMDPLATNRVTAPIVEPLTRAIRFAQFRYFNGSEWLEAWNGVDLPLGVEVTLGAEPMLPEDELYTGEIFRRVIFIPAGRAAETWEESL